MFARSGLFLPGCRNNFIVMKKLMDFLRERRIQLNYTQEYLADTLGVASSSISRWERGEVSHSLSQIVGYAKAVGLEETEVFAFLANARRHRPLPLAEVHLSIFSDEAYKAIMQTIADQGLMITITSNNAK